MNDEKERKEIDELFVQFGKLKDQRDFIKTKIERTNFLIRCAIDSKRSIIDLSRGVNNEIECADIVIKNIRRVEFLLEQKLSKFGNKKYYGKEY